MKALNQVLLQGKKIIIMVVQTRKLNAFCLGYQPILSSDNRYENMNKQLRKVKRKQCGRSQFEGKKVIHKHSMTKGKKLNPLNKTANK